MSKIKNTEELSVESPRSPRNAANSIVINGNVNDFRPAVQSAGRNTNQQVTGTKTSSTTKVQPSSPGGKQQLSEANMRAISRYERKLNDLDRVDPAVIKSILAAGVVREYEQKKEPSVPDSLHIEGVDDAELRYAIDNEFTAEQRARLHNIVNIFTNKDDAKPKGGRFRKDQHKMKEEGKFLVNLRQHKVDGYPYKFKYSGCRGGVERKFVVYDNRSCMVISADWRIRRAIVWLTLSPWFETFIILIIFFNSLFMAYTDYSFRVYTEDRNIIKKNASIEWWGVIFTYIFIVECFLKIIGMGFIVHKNSYLRDYWNWLDFIVVVVGIMEQVQPDASTGDMKSLRTLRVLRPLRSINAFPEMKRLIGSLLSSLPSLANAVLFMFFIFLLFGILGIQSFQGVLYQQCRSTPAPVFDPVSGKTTWPLVDEEFNQYARLCSPRPNELAKMTPAEKNKYVGGGQYQCDEQLGHFCGKPLPSINGYTLVDDDVPNMDYINYGIIHFDDIYYAMVTIIQMITLEGWSGMMYNLQDTSPPWMAIVFCVLLVIVGAWFLLNVILAVIMEAFEKIDTNQEKEQQKEKQELRDLKKLHGISDSIENSEDDERSCHSGRGNNNESGQCSNQEAAELIENNPPGVSVERLQDTPSQRNNSNMIQPIMIKEDSLQNKEIGMQAKQNNWAQLEQEAADKEKQDKPEASIDAFTSQVKDPLIVPAKESDTNKVLDEQEEQSPAKSPIVGGEEILALDIKKKLADGIQQTNKKKKKQVFIPARAFKNKCYMTFFKLCVSDAFNIFITTCIVLNTILLAQDRYPQKKRAGQVLADLNLVCSIIFIVEMVIKLIGLGFKEYVSDGFNIFDCVIVHISVFEIVIDLIGVEFSSGGALSALRAVRLLRVFKLARSWVSFRILLEKIMETLKHIWNFTVLMLIFMFIFTLLGMELYGHKIKYNDYDLTLVVVPSLTQHGVSPRVNFDDFMNGFMTIFIIFIGEDWNAVMYDHVRVQGKIHILFFILIFISGNIVLLNLFLAILLKNFEEPPSQDVDDVDDEDDGPKLTMGQKLKTIFCCCCIKTDQAQVQQVRDLNSAQNIFKSQQQEGIELQQNSEAKKSSQDQRSQGKDNLSGQGSEVKESVDNLRASANKKISIQQYNDLQSIKKAMQQKQRASPVSEIRAMDFGSLVNSVRENSQHSGEEINKAKEANDNGDLAVIEEEQLLQGRKSFAEKQGSQSNLSQGALSANKRKSKLIDQSKRTYMKQSSQDVGGFNEPLSPFKGDRSDTKKLNASSKRMISEVPQKVRGTNFSMGTIKLQEVQNASKPKGKVIQLIGNSCLIMSPENPFRVFCSKIVGHPYFDNAILLLIGFSTVLLSLENPLHDPQSHYVQTLKQIDVVVSIIFICELVIKVIVYGFCVNGKDSYIKNSWNQMDFLIVTFSIISMSFANVKLGIFKILRMLRVLRPLRMISRNPGLRIAVQSLINAIPDIGNVMVVSCLFLILFAILGTNFYKGKFYYCHDEQVPEPYRIAIHDKFGCMDFGGDWANQDQNFDNVMQSFWTLFNVMTTEGWIGVMFNAQDITEINKMPQRAMSAMDCFFFMFFIVVGHLFLLNMFIGIVINVFNTEKENLQMNHLLTKTQSEWCDVLVFIYNKKPNIIFLETGNKIKDMCYKIASYYLFDHFILLCILLNTLCLALKWYDEPDNLGAILYGFSLTFNIIYTIEAGIKLIGCGTDYFRDNWNNFDIVIVIAAWLGEVANAFGFELGAVMTVIKAFRCFRIFKIIKKYKSLRILFFTFVGALPQLTYVGGLLLLFIFLYSVLGVFMFADKPYQEAYDPHANFRNFGNATLTLFRMSTGESWHEIMLDCIRPRSVIFECKDQEDFADRNGAEPTVCGDPITFPFFITFMIIVSFIFINLFIAIILESFNDSTAEEGLQVGGETIFQFNEIWQRFDPKGRGFVRTDKFPKLISMIIDEEIKQIYILKKEIQNGDIEPISDEEFRNKIFMFNLCKNEILFSVAVLNREKLFNQMEEAQKMTEQVQVEAPTSAYKSQVLKEYVTTHQDQPDPPCSSSQAQRAYESGSGTDDLNFIEKLSIPLGVREKAEKARTKKTHINEFIKELRLPCYDVVKYYYYYDVIEGLCRSLFQDRISEQQMVMLEEDGSSGGSLHGHHHHHDHAESEKFEPDSKASNNQADEFSNNQGKGGPGCDVDGHSHGDVNLEEEQDILEGDFERILMKLEQKGANNSIFKFKEMQQLRAQRNKRVQERLEIFGMKKSVIDSSQVVGAYQIIRFYRRFQARKAKKLAKANERQGLTGQLGETQYGENQIMQEVGEWHDRQERANDSNEYFSANQGQIESSGVVSANNAVQMDKETVKKKEMNAINTNIMPLIKEAENEDKDQGESRENSEQLTHRGNFMQGRDSRPQVNLYSGSGNGTQSDPNQNSAGQIQNMIPGDLRNEMSDPSLLANNRVPSGIDMANPNEDQSQNMIDARRQNFANTKHESGPGNMQGGAVMEEFKDNRNPLLIDFTGEQVGQDNSNGSRGILREPSGSALSGHTVTSPAVEPQTLSTRGLRDASANLLVNAATTFAPLKKERDNTASGIARENSTLANNSALALNESAPNQMFQRVDLPVGKQPRQNSTFNIEKKNKSQNHSGDSAGNLNAMVEKVGKSSSSPRNYDIDN